MKFNNLEILQILRYIGNIWKLEFKEFTSKLEPI